MFYALEMIVLNFENKHKKNFKHIAHRVVVLRLNVPVLNDNFRFLNVIVH